MLPRIPLAALAALALFSSALGSMSSPEPIAEPIFGPALYVVSAGRSSERGPMLTDGSKICPADYPTGLSILCEPSAPSRWARFFVDGRFQKVEWHAPYYIAGDYKGKVTPWTTYPPHATILCKLSDGSSVDARVSFSC